MAEAAAEVQGEVYQNICVSPFTWASLVGTVLMFPVVLCGRTYYTVENAAISE